jgi:two-component system CheB/CheR fusion protein
MSIPQTPDSPHLGKISSKAFRQQFGDGLFASEDETFFQIVQNIPAAVYATDAEGRITFFNEAAAALWGRRPKLGEDWWCGSWRLYWPDGSPMGHDECPMAVTLKTRRPVRGAEAIAERPDGTRYPFIPYPTPLFDAEGKLVGAVNMLVDITERKRNEEAAQRLAAIVDSADDAIISKDLDGIIRSWNQGAERLFGYTAEEILGQPVTTLMPPDRRDEERGILERLRRGERIDHFETVRQRKDGSLIEISLTVSPVRNAEGKIIGASKVARDISERRRAEETKEVLLNELQHRARNTLGTIQAIATQTFREAPNEERRAFSGRIEALAKVQDVLTRHNRTRAAVDDVVETALVPFGESDRCQIGGPDASLNTNNSLHLAMILHELGTNAVKYGALSNGDGVVAVTWELAYAEDGARLKLCWRESNGPAVNPPRRKGFGSTLIERILQGGNGKAELEFAPSGVICTLEMAI